MKMHVNYFIILLFVFSTGIIKAQMTDEVTKDLDEHRLSLLQNLNKCYEVAEDILGSNEQDSSEKYMLEGKRYYELAYRDWLELQLSKYKLEENKIKIVSRALGYYAKGFYNIDSFGGFNVNELNDIKKDLENWPFKEIDTKKENEDEIHEFELKSGYAMGITLPEEGTWCLWEITNEGRIWLDGTIPNKGYARFDIYYDQLPIYLGSEKYYEIRNSSINYQTIKVIFKQCKLK